MRKHDPEFLEKLFAPQTTRHAFRLGEISGSVGYERMKFRELLRNQEPGSHPWPSSLYRAYRLGWEKGHKKWLRKRAGASE